MKYSEEKIIDMLKNFSSESKIKHSLKLDLLSRKKSKKILFFGLSFSAIAAVMLVILLAGPRHHAEEQYIYGHYPIMSSELYDDSYGEAGPRGLDYMRY